MELKIEYVDKELLKPYANNAKVHSAEQIEQIKNSIRQFSFNDPIAVWHDNVIIEGHGRLLAVMEMDEIDTVPIIRLDGLTDEQRRAYALAHNKLTMSSPFNIDLLNMELNELADFDIDMSEFGFEDAEADIDGFFEQEQKTEKAISDEKKVIVKTYEDKLEELETLLKENGYVYEVK